MGYSGARGGIDAIEAAEKLVRRKRLNADYEWVSPQQIVGRFRLAVDRVMGEAGIWDEELTAIAIRQAEGDLIEAVHLLRSYKSTLPRFAYSKPTDADELQVVRRIVPAFRNPPGPQLLGRTTDYTGRLLELTSEQAGQEESMLLASLALTDDQESLEPTTSDEDTQPRRLLETLREMDLLVDRRREDDPEPFDITRTPARPPASRSARLSSMARAETGALVNQWYRNILGPDGYLHEVTLGEVRHGYLALRIEHPLTGNTISIGTVRVTEVEAIEDLNGIDEQRDRFDIGYGLCLGHNEKKAIAMANLDIACHRDAGRSQLEQSLLLTTDGLESSGFLEHLKLPHYVTFRSMVERKIAVRESKNRERSS